MSLDQVIETVLLILHDIRGRVLAARVVHLAAVGGGGGGAELGVLLGERVHLAVLRLLADVQRTARLLHDAARRHTRLVRLRRRVAILVRVYRIVDLVLVLLVALAQLLDLRVVEEDGADFRCDRIANAYHGRVVRSIVLLLLLLLFAEIDQLSVVLFADCLLVVVIARSVVVFGRFQLRLSLRLLGRVGRLVLLPVGDESRVGSRSQHRVFHVLSGLKCSEIQLIIAN